VSSSFTFPDGITVEGPVDQFVGTIIGELKLYVKVYGTAVSTTLHFGINNVECPAPKFAVK
jgi:hypothetical protein